MIKRSFIYPLAAVCMWGLPLNAATTGATFLELGDGARPLALAGAYAAVPGDVDSLTYNPAGAAFLTQPEATATHSDWLENTEFDVVTYGHPTKVGTFSASAMRMGSGNFEGRDVHRQQTGTFTADDVVALISYAKNIGSSVGVGASAKYLRSRIADDSASSVAMDAGAEGHIPGLPVWVGGSVLNMGSGLRFRDQVDRLPLTIDAGLAAQPIQYLLLATNFVHLPYDSQSHLRVGAEVTVSYFSFRMGYDQRLQGEDRATLSVSQNVRGGIGIHWNRYRADYTLAPFGDLGLTQRFTLGIRFGPLPAESTGPHNMKAILGEQGF